MIRRIAAAMILVAGLPLLARAELADAVTLYEGGQYEEAFDAFAALAAEGDGEAMLYLGEMFENGQGVDQSRTRAFKWYRRAALHDVAEGHFRIGEMYESGIGVPRNHAQAVLAYEAAAELGHDEAMVRLAALYIDGVGAMPDASAAARILSRAAEGGNAAAQEALDDLVASGTVPRGVLDELGIPPPPPPSLPTVEELAAEELAAQAELLPDDDAMDGDAAAGGELTGDGTKELSQPELATTPQDDATGDAMSDDAMAPEDEPATDTMASEAEGTEVERMMRERLEQVLAIVRYEPEVGESYEYLVDVEEFDDGRVIAAVRDILLASPKGTWDIGDVVLELTPIAEGVYDAVFTAPAETLFYDAAGREVGYTRIGAQDLAGVYNMPLNLWTESSGGLHDIEVNLTDDGGDTLEMAIGAITVEGRMEEVAPGKYSGPGRGEMSGLEVRGNGTTVASVESMVLETDQRAIDYVFFQAVNYANARVQAELGPYPDLANTGVAAYLREIWEPVLMLARERAPLMGDAGFLFELSGIEGRDPETGERVGFDSMTFGMRGEALDTPTGTILIDYAHEGLTVDLDPATQGYLPHAASFHLALRDLPMLDAATIALEIMQDGLDDPAGFEQNVEIAMGTTVIGLLPRMAEAGSRVVIEDTYLVSDKIVAQLSGEITATDASPMGAVGTVTLEIAGLEEAVAQLSEMTDDPDAQEMAMPLAMLQSMGQRTERDGAVHHIYVVELTADGRTLLNGNDMGPMMDGMMQ